ncbi:MAG: hypothetical protein IT379_11775 [Deltaproteobacteria bacterium]|nr:hypothetical protein [Deltaproteobacteria bacterium]
MFDPGSAPELVDYLTITASSGLRGAAIGAGVGGLVGLAFGRPLAGAVAGGGVGLVAGAAHGVNKVARGWRVRAVYDANGEPTVAIHALPA